MSTSAPITVPAFVPIFLETDSTVLARLLASLPDGLSQEPGTFTSDWLQGSAAEFARVWAMLNQLGSQQFVSWATGQQLDANAASYGLLRSQGTYSTGLERFYGPEGTPVPPGIVVQAPQSDPNADVLQYQTINIATAYTTAAGYVDVPISALQVGLEFNQPAGAITLLNSSIDGVTAITNPNATTGGSDVEGDSVLRTQVLEQAQFPVGSGTQLDYQAWGLEVPGVGDVSVYPQWDTAGVNPGIYDGRQNGSVLLALRDTNNAPVSALVLQAAQAHICPSRAILGMFEDQEGWFAYTPTDISTTISGAQTLPESTITVASTTGFSDSGTLDIEGIGEVTYTATTATTFTGCAGGTGPVPDGATVAQITPVDITWDTADVQAGGASLELDVPDGSVNAELSAQDDLSGFSGQWPSVINIWVKASDWADVSDDTELLLMTDDEDYFSAPITTYSSGSGTAAPDTGDEWWLWAVDLDQFTATGAPDWADIETIRVTLAATAAITMNLDYMYACFAAGAIGNGGRAPLGADVSCVAPVIYPVDVTITSVLLDDGYALVDTPGTTNALTILQTNLTAFFQSLAPGATLRLVDLVRAIHNSAGFLDFDLTEPTENIPLTGMQYGQLGELSVSS